MEKKHVFLVGAKSMGAYGGYETFVDKLTQYHENHPSLLYHVACKANGDGHMDESKLSNVSPISDREFMYHNAHCFKIRIPQIGPAQAIYYDCMALKYCCDYIRREHISDAVVYIMACRIGPFMKHFFHKLHRLGAEVYLNPDGHEWKRAKWNWLIRKYWRYSERKMVQFSDLVICDSVNIEKYIHDSYDQRLHRRIHTTYIAYGAETRRSTLSDADERVVGWYKEKDVTPHGYYLVVGRFVPENNYETMIREFMKSDSSKDFVIITNVNDAFLTQLEARLHYSKDARIKFVGTVYDQELLMKIRENAYGYFHGHEVGGTNPSLLEALACTDLNLLLQVPFNQEVAEDAAVYWTKKEGNLAALIHKVEAMSENERKQLGQKARRRIKAAYSWDFICKRYAEVFCGDK